MFCDYEILNFFFCRSHRAKPIIIDPGLYMSKKADVFWVSQKRSMPTAFKLFTGLIIFPLLGSYLIGNMFKSIYESMLVFLKCRKLSKLFTGHLIFKSPSFLGYV